jgi:hypothetical protein
MTERSPVTGRAFTTKDVLGYTLSTRDGWYVFTPRDRANRVYLESVDTVHSHAPSASTPGQGNHDGTDHLPPTQ